MSRIAALAALSAAVLIARHCGGDDPPPARLRVATFNIEDFPKHDRQIVGAFDEIARLDAPIVAVQEIVDPELFERTARARLGADWRFVSAYTGPAAALHPVHHLGVVFDTRRFTHVRTRVHDGTRLEGRQKPTLDVELRAATGEHLRVLVVHLKAGGENQPIRARQHAALRRIVAEVARGGAPVILLGDFNATSDADRVELARTAKATGTHWATEPLACSSFWNRDDGCPRSRLDHALTTAAPVAVEAAGACATEGCEAQDRCPLYTEQVSDHCPVVVAF